MKDVLDRRDPQAYLKNIIWETRKIWIATMLTNTNVQKVDKNLSKKMSEIISPV
jgi:hypothetical protein